MFSICCNSRIKSQKIGKYPDRKSKIKPFIDKYNWQGKKYSSEKDDRKKINKNKLMIPLNVLYAKHENIYPAYISKQNSKSKKQVFLLMIPNRRHYLTVKISSVLLR